MRPLGFFITCSPFAVGCLADPPVYEDLSRIPPVVAFAQVSPPTSVVYELGPDEQRMEINVPFRSEDLGSPVLGKFLVDALPGIRSAESILDVIERPSDFSTEGRAIRTEVTGLDRYEGCHALTLVLTHESNTNRFTDALTDESLAVRIDWLFSRPRIDGEPTLLSDCPTRGKQDSELSP
jgi:hypothetical protein